MSVEHSEQGQDQQTGNLPFAEASTKQTTPEKEDSNYIRLAEALLAIEKVAHGGDDLRSFTQPSLFALD